MRDERRRTKFLGAKKGKCLVKKKTKGVEDLVGFGWVDYKLGGGDWKANAVVDVRISL